MAPSRHECSQVGCGDTAAISYVWPGRPDRSFACTFHGFMAARIVTAMGFELGDVKRCDELAPYVATD
jgi:hypothetical protein